LGVRIFTEKILFAEVAELAIPVVLAELAVATIDAAAEGSTFEAIPFAFSDIWVFHKVLTVFI